MSNVKSRQIRAFADQYNVTVDTDDNKNFTFWTPLNAVFLGRAASVSEACAWMRGYGCALGYPIPGAPKPPIGA